MSKKWLIYTRVSTKGQEERYGLDAQKNILTDYAKRMGWDYELLDEGGVSGETIYERPKMIELLDKIKTGRYEGCLVIEEERLSRSKRLGDWDDIKEAFREGKAKIATPSRMLDPESLDDDFLLDLSGVLSKREKRIILKRMTRGKAEKLKQGKSIGGTSTPFGYRANPETSKLEICPEEKKAYDMMVDWILEGEGIYTVANKLNKMGIPTRYGRKGWKMKKRTPTNLWRASTIYKILKQEFYTGLKPITFHFTKYHTEDVNVHYPALISPDKFWQLQSKLAGQSPKRKQNSYFFLLKDLLECGLCGRKMYGHGSPKQRKDGRTYVYKFYRCENRNPPPKGTNCPMKSVEQYKVEDAVWNEVLKLVNNSDMLARIIKEKQEKMDDTIQDSSSKLQSLQEMLSNKEEEEQRLLTAYRQGVISLEDLDVEKKKITKEKTELVKEISKLETEKRSLVFDKEKTRSIQDYFQDVKKKVASLSPEDKYSFYHLCVDSMTLSYDDKQDRHSISINYAIPLALENFSSRNHENISKVIFYSSLESLQKLHFTVTAEIPQANRQRKTAKYLSSFEICKIIGIDQKTYRRHEGGLFPIARRNPPNGFRIFTRQEANRLKTLWERRAEYFSRRRHYRYHKTRNFFSLAEACKAIGISPKTFRKHEGSLFPVIWRDNKAGRRLFTEKDIEQIKEAWQNHKMENYPHLTLPEQC